MPLNFWDGGFRLRILVFRTSGSLHFWGSRSHNVPYLTRKTKNQAFLKGNPSLVSEGYVRRLSWLVKIPNAHEKPRQHQDSRCYPMMNQHVRKANHHGPFWSSKSIHFRSLKEQTEGSIPIFHLKLHQDAPTKDAFPYANSGGASHKAAQHVFFEGEGGDLGFGLAQ